jgi:hypothetical protein
MSFAVARAGTGKTGFMPVPPNNYPFYSQNDIYTPVVQSDGGQLSGACGAFARNTVLCSSLDCRHPANPHVALVSCLLVPASRRPDPAPREYVVSWRQGSVSPWLGLSMKLYGLAAHS